MRSSLVTLPPRAAVRPRIAHARTIALLAAQLALVAALLWFCLPQSLGGRADWVLVSGTSMLPHLHTGDLVLVEHQPDYHVGEVVAYRVPQGQVGAGHVVIHRIIGGNGRTGWKMQGDNRTAPDLWHPTNHDVIGSKELRIPDAWFVLRIFHMPVLLALFAGFVVFFWIAFTGEPEAEPVETEDPSPSEDEFARDAFVAAVSHELRTPLTSVAGFLELLGDEENSLASTGRTYLTAARRGTARLQRIVEDLLLVAELEAGLLELHTEPVDLAELAAAAVEESGAAAAEKRIAISLDTDGPLPLEADAARLRQVLDNLLSTAIKHTSAGGAVVLSASESDGRRRIEVSDNGMGVPAEAIPGTGLGLVVARAIVERHGGTISLESREGEGTRVTVTLPARQSAGGTYR